MRNSKRYFIIFFTLIKQLTFLLSLNKESNTFEKETKLKFFEKETESEKIDELNEKFKLDRKNSTIFQKRKRRFSSVDLKKL